MNAVLVDAPDTALGKRLEADALRRQAVELELRACQLDEAADWQVIDTIARASGELDVVGGFAGYDSTDAQVVTFEGTHPRAFHPEDDTPHGYHEAGDYP